ncbi:MAG: FAD-dependent oxidoreductase [Hyphomicrobiaceae bacterium]
MDRVDVAVVGGGVAGSLAALMLGRAGYRVCLIDPVRPRGTEFRCEKLEHAHVQALQQARLADEILPGTLRYEGIWIGRHGKLAERRNVVEFGIDYAGLVNRLHQLLPDRVSVLDDKVIEADIVGRSMHRRLHLAGGGQIDARLVVLATGSNADALATFGYTQRMVRRCHSISIGFDLVPGNTRLANLGALTWFGERPRDRIAYLTIFPLAGRLRANLFVYRQTDDTWLREFRARPSAVLADSLPGFTRTIGTLDISGPIRFRSMDLVDTEAKPQPGVVLVGDAFGTACPASGTGASKAMIDVERLCNIHVPRWLGSDAVGPSQIAAFYGDREKQLSDRHSRKVSLFARRIALEEGGLWTALRWARAAASRSRRLLPRTNDHAGQLAEVPTSATH